MIFNTLVKQKCVCRKKSQAFLLVFAAEIGDRSFISAAALSAQGGPEGAVAVFIGSISAHGVATLLAVALGDLISSYVSAAWMQDESWKELGDRICTDWIRWLDEGEGCNMIWSCYVFLWFFKFYAISSACMYTLILYFLTFDFYDPFLSPAMSQDELDRSRCADDLTMIYIVFI